MVAAPMLSTPVASAIEVVEMYVHLPGGRIERDIDGLPDPITFCDTTVPETGAMLNRLMPVGPEVTASSVSAPLPEIWLPTITLSFILTGGAGDGAAA